MPQLKYQPEVVGKAWTKVGGVAGGEGRLESFILVRRFQDYIVTFVQRLVDAKVDTRRKLEAKWKSDPHCKRGHLQIRSTIGLPIFHVPFLQDLLKAYSLWVHEDSHAALAASWPPVDVPK